MGVNFSPFEIGRRALRASQLGLNITGQNIANVNTPGYTRQSVQLSVGASGGSSIGGGGSIDGVRSFRDRFVESRLQTETAIAGRLTAKRDALAPVDAAFNEAAGGGISSSINTFFGAFRELEAQPASVPLRAVAVEKASELATAFGSTSARLQSIRSDTNNALQSTVDDVNALASQVATLNADISVAEHSGENASELRDQRGEAVRQLSELTGVHAVEDDQGMVTLTLGDGRALVLGDHATPLEAVNAPSGESPSFLLDGEPVNIADGRLCGLVDAIDNISAQVESLDQLAASIASRVNALHSSGTDLNGNAGGNFFAVPAGGAPVTAGNLAVSAAIQANPSLVVASTIGPAGAQTSVAGAIANLLTDSSSQAGERTGSFSAIYGSIVSEAGQGVRSAEDALSIHQVILAQATAQRDSISGVSLDEEAINMMQYQKAYEAAARFLNIANEMTQMILSLGQ